MNKRTLSIMVQGTHSDAGKSVVATALCRVFANRGLRAAPFKSQNMSLNSYVTPDGKEIGRAQGVQAEAARTAATVEMNPILIKPSGDMTSQIVVLGKPYAQLRAGEYRDSFFETGLKVIREAYGRLSREYDAIVIEGAGSPAEVNLNDRELVNMRVARLADAPVVLVGDIDRGGVFASLVGTMQLLEPADRERVIGFVINKFRGDFGLLQPGLDWLERYTGKPVLGVLPYMPDLRIDAEDSLNVPASRAGEPRAAGELDIVVVRLPRISNFTDFEPLAAEPDVRLRYEDDPRKLGKPDMIVLPGSKNTIEDLLWLRDRGWADAVRAAAEGGEAVLAGICGGYQMLGLEVTDPYGVESQAERAEGLGLLPIRTAMTEEKRTVRVQGMLELDGIEARVSGYELHMGVTSRCGDGDAPPLIELDDGSQDGACTADGRLFGTYLHDLFHNDGFRHAWLDRMRSAKGLAPLAERTKYSNAREQAFDALAEAAERHVDIEAIMQAMLAYAERSGSAGLESR